MLGSLAHVFSISTKLISKITVTNISTILRLIFVDFDNPAQRKKCEFSKSESCNDNNALDLILAIFCRTIATIRNFAKLQPLSNVNPIVFLISLCLTLSRVKVDIPRIHHLSYGFDWMHKLKLNASQYVSKDGRRNYQ